MMCEEEFRVSPLTGEDIDCVTLTYVVSYVAQFSGNGSAGDGSSNLYLSKQDFNLPIIVADALHTSKSLSSFRVTRST